MKRPLSRILFASAFSFALGALGQSQVERINIEGAARLPAFSHATSLGGFVFVSGTLGTQTTDVTNPQLADTVGEQTTQTLKNIETVLAEVGADRTHIAKCNVYLTDMGEFAAMNEAYIAFFGEEVPARTTVGVSELALGAKVEIECIALRPSVAVQIPASSEGEGDTAVSSILRTTGSFESGGETIYYESVGEGDPVVFGHGLGGNHAVWYQQAPVFGRNYRMITWDQRAFGRSTNTAGKASPASAVEDLRALLDHLGIERAHLVGQSMGGWAVLGFALQYPERVRSLVMASTIGGIYSDAIEEHFDAYIQQVMSAPPESEWPIHYHPALDEAWAEQNPAQAYLYKELTSFTPPAPASMGLMLRQTSYDNGALSKLNVPVLFVVGERDPIFPPGIIREAAELLPNAEVREIADAGHSPYFSRPVAWNEAVLAFVEKF